MELIIKILMLFILINCVVKLSFWKLWQVAIFAVASAIFVIFACQYATEQSKTQLADYLANTKIMHDMAVLITIESALCFAFCFAALQGMVGKKTKRWIDPLYWYPSLLIFPVLFYILTQAIFGMTGSDFMTISYILAGICLIGFPLLTMGVRYLLPERELRLEVHFLVSLFVCIIGLITTVDGNVTYAATETSGNGRVIALAFGLFAFMFFVGFVWSRLKWSIFNKKRKSNQLR